MSDINTAVVDSLKVLDLKWPIREADIHYPYIAAVFKNAQNFIVSNFRSKIPVLVHR